MNPVFAEDGEFVLREFAPTPPMSTYLVAFAVGRLTHVSMEDTECFLECPDEPLETQIRVWATECHKDELAFALNTAQTLLLAYTEAFAEPFPLAKLDLVAIPDFPMDAMENWGLISFSEYDLFVGADDHEGMTSMAQRDQVVFTIAKEMANQWFGNLVTIDWWNDVWLKEGIASYIKYFG